MKNLFTNRSSKSDFVQNAFYEYAEDGMDIFIASAFFTEMDVINLLSEKKCNIRIIVRLGFPTSPFALEKLLQNENVEARFFTSNSFHPKMYIFGDRNILIGSANLTKAAILTNQEIVVGLQSDDPRFEVLIDLFSEYWAQAKVLTKSSVENYKTIYQKFSKVSTLAHQLDDQVSIEIGDHNFSNINRGKAKESEESIFIDTYRKAYQESVSAFKRINEIYKTHKRRVPEKDIPLRLEIDSFFSYVRDKHAVNNSWENMPIGFTASSKEDVNNLIHEWHSQSWAHFEDEIVQTNYPKIVSVFSSKDSISQASEQEIVDALCVLHSFHDRLRFFHGGLETLKTAFIEENDMNKVRSTLAYLLHGNDDVITRMANCIFNQSYKLNQFGKSNVQELIGWINKEELPVINGRTTKVLRFFGFNISQV